MIFKDLTETSPQPTAFNSETLTNQEFVDGMGTPVQVIPGCPFFSGETTKLKMAMYVSQKDVRLVAVCVPSKE